jgi:hypothetical protein
MSRSLLDQQGESECQTTLEEVLQYLQSLHAIVGTLIAEVTAIRKTVINDQDSLEHFESNLKLAMNEARPAIEEAVGPIEEFEREETEISRWKN